VKIYTRTGDDGTTGLLGAARVSKADARIEAYGTVDELNAALGAARALDTERWLESGLARVQASLFQIGAELAADDGAALAKLDRIDEAAIASLETWIDRLEADLPPLKRFILPGGTPLAASSSRAWCATSTGSRMRCSCWRAGATTARARPSISGPPPDARRVAGELTPGTWPARAPAHAP
jgi:cob(I)alamin adenosyltransferase